MTEDEIQGCDSYRQCPSCGHIQFFNNRPRLDSLNLLERNYQSDPRSLREHETDEKTMICEKCGARISLC